jgi:hypothetical protein
MSACLRFNGSRLRPPAAAGGCIDRNREGVVVGRRQKCLLTAAPRTDLFLSYDGASSGADRRKVRQGIILASRSEHRASHLLGQELGTVIPRHSSKRPRRPSGTSP